MKPYYSSGGIEIYLGDCRDVVPSIGLTVATLITDPPYGLEFMGQGWDHGVPDAETWLAFDSSLVPGSMILAFGGTRTWHRLTCAIEDAGYEIRDCLLWLYGAGFPKSHNIAKAIDKARVEDVPRIREICRWIRAAMDARGLKSRHLAPAFGCDPRLVDHWAARDTDSQPSLPTSGQFAEVKRLLELGGERDDLFAELDARRGDPGDAWTGAEVIGEYSTEPPGLVGVQFTRRDATIREPSLQAATWDGWGTALKPAWEPIVLAMKPTDGTFAANALKHGVAGLNIDGGRIGVEGGTTDTPDGAGSRTNEVYGEYGSCKTEPSGTGRFPANLLLDEAAAEMLDEQSGFSVTPATVSRGPSRGTPADYVPNSSGEIQRGIPCHGDSGGASRFFYTAKASSRDRGTVTAGALPLFGEPEYEDRNEHPTVKPTGLMEYLCRLTASPTGGLVLDPFMGSGTTLVAAKRVGRPAVGVELEERWAEFAAKRLERST